MANTLQLISFSVVPDREAEFNRFYQQSFLCHLAKESPEVVNIRRYEEFTVGSPMRWYSKQYLTIYQLTDDATKSGVDIFARPAVADVVKEFRSWKEQSLHNFSRITFEQTWCHPRQPSGGAFAGRPFFLWQLEMKPKMDQQFQDWYEGTYLPLQVAEIPTWAGVVRYASVEREPVRHLTFFEANDETVLQRCLTDLRSAHRIGDNLDWQKRVEPAVTWQDATTFRPVFRWPD